MAGYVLEGGGIDPQFAKMMVTLAEVLGVALTEARIRIYARLLGDVAADRLQLAFRAAADTCRGGCFPSPGELRGFIGSAEGDAALLAWASLGCAADEAGAYASVEFEDWATAAALERVFGSWPAYCEIPEGPALGARRQEFLAAYREARRQQRQREPRRVLGLCETAGTPVAETWLARVALDGGVAHRRGTPWLPGAKPVPALAEGAPAAKEPSE